MNKQLHLKSHTSIGATIYMHEFQNLNDFYQKQYMNMYYK